MKRADRKKLWARLEGKVNFMGDNFPHIVVEIDRAVRKARREERACFPPTVDVPPIQRPPVFAGDRGVKGGWWLEDLCKCGHKGARHARPDVSGSPCEVRGCRCGMYREKALTRKLQRA